MKNKTAFITGATSGIGMATAKLFAKNGLKLILCGRREDRLKILLEELSTSTEVHTLRFDVRNKEEVFSAINSLPQQFSEIDILINNAGNAHGMDTIEEGSIEDWDAMLDINVKGLLYVSKTILPKMIERKRGHIINIGSTAGKEIYPKGNVYCASKHAVDAINPGLVKTEFSEVRFKGDSERAEKVYKGYTPLKPEDIADIIWFAVTRPPHVNIADLTVMCLDQASSTIVNKN